MSAHVKVIVNFQVAISVLSVTTKRRPSRPAVSHISPPFIGLDEQQARLAIPAPASKRSRTTMMPKRAAEKACSRPIGLHSRPLLVQREASLRRQAKRKPRRQCKVSSRPTAMSAHWCEAEATTRAKSGAARGDSLPKVLRPPSCPTHSPDSISNISARAGQTSHPLGTWARQTQLAPTSSRLRPRALSWGP